MSFLGNIIKRDTTFILIYFLVMHSYSLFIQEHMMTYDYQNKTPADIAFLILGVPAAVRLKEVNPAKIGTVKVFKTVFQPFLKTFVAPIFAR